MVLRSNFEIHDAALHGLQILAGFTQINFQYRIMNYAMTNSVLSQFISNIVRLWKGFQLSSWSPLQSSNTEKSAFLKPILVDFAVILVVIDRTFPKMKTCYKVAIITFYNGVPKRVLIFLLITFLLRKLLLIFAKVY